MLTIIRIQALLDDIDWSRSTSELETTRAHLLRSASIEGVEIEEIEQGEYDAYPITVWRDSNGEPLWIAADDAQGVALHTDPATWADTVEDYARAEGWDADEAPVVATAYDRAGVHRATGIQYEPSRTQRIEAASETAQMRLYRQIRGLPLQLEGPVAAK